MAFDINIQHWHTVAEFAQYLRNIPKPDWCRGITDHNTYIPNEYQWRGMASMLSMMAEYVRKGWSAGPNLYLCGDSINPDDRGIWQMTPIAHSGIHAGPCNKDHLGIENVGDFQARKPTANQWGLCLDVNELIIRQWKLDVNNVHVHKECMPGRTCPGQYFSADQLRNDLKLRLNGPTPDHMTQYRVKFNSSVVRTDTIRKPDNIATFGTNGPRIILPLGFEFISDGIKLGETIGGSNRWIHIKLPAEWGFIHDSLVELT